jgi:hypothetical protein
MIRWIFLAIAACSFVSVWGQVPIYVLLAAFLLAFGNFATFCILYDRPQNRAQLRVAAHLKRTQPYTDVAPRLQKMSVTTTAADRHLGYGLMPMLNLATGIAASGLLVWGIILRIR